MSFHDFLSGAQAGQGLFGSIDGEELQHLIKAMDAGDQNPPTGGTPGAGDPLRLESLEKTLTRLTFTDEHCPMWRNIPKEAAYSTVEEFNVLNSYGAERLSAFTSEGELPTADDATYTRKNVKVKFMGTLRAVSHPLGLVRTAHGDVIAQETINGTMWLMRQIEKSLFFGSSSVVETEYDGFWQQMTDGDTTVIDRAGGDLTMDSIEDAAEQIYGVGGFGKLDCIYYGSGTHKRFAQNLFGTANANVRLNADNVMGGPAVPGFSLKRVATVFGDVDVKPDVFLQPNAVDSIAVSGDSSKRPSDATAQPSTALSAGANTVNAYAVGNYRHLCVGLNKFGNSASSAAAADQAMILADINKSINVTLTFNGSIAPDGVEVYRTTEAGGNQNYFLVDRFVWGGNTATTLGGNTTSGYNAGAGTILFEDKNAMIAGTGLAFGFTSTQNTFAFKQLAPFMKVNLAQIDLRSRWAQILYGAPVLRAPKKCVLFKNVKARD